VDSSLVHEVRCLGNSAEILHLALIESKVSALNSGRSVSTERAQARFYQLRRVHFSARRPAMGKAQRKWDARIANVHDTAAVPVEEIVVRKSPPLCPPGSNVCSESGRESRARLRLLAENLYRGKVHVVRGFLTLDESAAWQRYCSSAQFVEETHKATWQTAYRDNGRLETWNLELATAIWDRLRGLVPARIDGMTAVGCHEKIRLYRYASSGRQRFGKHVDESTIGAQRGTQTGVTVLIYLNGEAEGLAGGETVFYKGNGSSEAARFTPETGAMLFHGQ
jgi:hypothetical protein